MLLLTLLLQLFCAIPSQAFFSIQKAECNALNLKHCYFEHCEIRTDAKGQTLINFHVALRDRRPMNDITVAKTYRMQIFNETIDFCDYMGDTAGAKMFGFIVQYFNKFSNVNHSCPYQHDIIYYGIEKGRLFSEIPAPKGNYMLQMRVATDQKLKANIKFYAKQN